MIVLLHLDINSFQISSSEQFFSCIAVIWIKDPLLHEVSVAGLRQGVTKKNLSSSKARYMVFPFYYCYYSLIFLAFSLGSYLTWFTIATKQLLVSNSEFAEIPESVKHFPAIPPEVYVGSCCEKF